MVIQDFYVNILDDIMDTSEKFLLGIHTFCSYFICLLVACFCFIPALILVAVLPEKSRRTNFWLFLFLDLTYRGVMWATLSRVTVRGAEHMPAEPAIFVANHESSLDIPVFGSLMKGSPHAWYVLDRFFHTPVLGFFVRRMSISVKQECAKAGSQALRSGMRVMQNYNVHILIFPQGGRWTDGKVHDFFHGFALLAKKMQRPVVPVFMKNLGKVYPPHSVLLHPYPISIFIGTPFVYNESESVEEFSHRVRQWFVAQYDAQ